MARLESPPRGATAQGIPFGLYEPGPLPPGSSLARIVGIERSPDMRMFWVSCTHRRTVTVIWSLEELPATSVAVASITACRFRRPIGRQE